jgi:hypothetical protein
MIPIAGFRLRTEGSVTMSSRLDKSWTVLASHQTPEADRCVDVFSRRDGTFGFEEFRRDPEDMGAWTAVSYYSCREYPTADAARIAAQQAVPWLSSILDR